MNVRYSISLIGITLLCRVAFPQESMIRFLDVNGKEVDSISSYYYEKTLFNSNNDRISYFTRSKKLRYKEVETDEKDRKLRSQYYETGNLRAEGIFYLSLPQGIVKSYYENGRKKSELYFREWNGGSRDIEIINYFDSLGNYLIENGKGVCLNCNLNPFSEVDFIESGSVENKLKHGDWRGNSNDNRVSFLEQYDKGVLTQGIQKFEGKEFKYTEIETMAIPKGGLLEFYKFIGKEMVYPIKARRKGIEGKVFIRFVIDKDGSIIEVEIVKGIAKICDDEAVRVMKLSPKWNPGLQRGRPVKQRYTLPIIFKLG
jgi:TonB family protein